MSASCLGYFDRVCYGFYGTSSRMLVLIEGEQSLTAMDSVYTKYTAIQYQNRQRINLASTAALMLLVPRLLLASFADTRAVERGGRVLR